MIKKFQQVALHYLQAKSGMDLWVMRSYMLLAGFLLAQAFAPMNWAPLVFLLMPFFVLVVKLAPSKRHAFWHGWFMGFGFAVAGLHWISASFLMQTDVPQSLAPYAVAALAAVFGIFKGLTFLLAKNMESNGAFRVIGFVGAWMALELFQGTMLTGFPWLLIGSIWADWTPMLQGAALIGLYGLGTLTVFIAASMYLFFETTPLPRQGVLPFFALGLLLVWAAFGVARLSNAPTEFHPNTKLRIIQANIDQRYKWHPQLLDRHFNDHVTLSRNDSLSGRAEDVDLLIWPETAVPDPLDLPDSLKRYRLSKLLDRGAYALTGAPRYTSGDDGFEVFNSLFVVNSDALVSATYDKSHLVPFGEYMPLKPFFDLFGLGQLVGGSGFSSGPGPETISLPGIPAFSPLICYEIIFPDSVIDRDNRPEWLLNITNDGWFGTTSGPFQHLALTRIRAVEEGLPVVRAAGTGISVVIDPYGRDVAKMGLLRKGIINSALPKSADDLPTLNTNKTIPQIILVVIFLFLSRFKRETK